MFLNKCSYILYKMRKGKSDLARKVNKLCELPADFKSELTKLVNLRKLYQGLCSIKMNNLLFLHA